MPEIEGEFVFQKIVVIIGSDVNRNVPLLALVEMEVVLDFVRTAGRLQDRLRDDLGFYISISERHR
jgi:hypothetical protein